MVPTGALRAGAGKRSDDQLSTNDDGRRWWAPAVSVYQACALAT